MPHDRTAESGRDVASLARAVRFKVCGLTRVDDVATAVAAGASFVGAIRAGGPRLLSPETLAQVLSAAPAGVQRVGVFGVQSLDAIRREAELAALDVVQLHATPTDATLVEAIAAVQRDGRLAWPVLRVPGVVLPPESETLAAQAGHLVLDAHVAGQLGGTGVPLDWTGLQEAVLALRGAVPTLTLVLGGGLRAENVASAIQLLRPQVVDVSSGVEAAPGVKDPERVRQFAAAVHGTAEMAS